MVIFDLLTGLEDEPQVIPLDVVRPVELDGELEALTAPDDQLGVAGLLGVGDVVLAGVVAGGVLLDVEVNAPHGQHLLDQPLRD